VKSLLATTTLPALHPQARIKLEPFISAFDQVLIARARRSGFRKAGRRTLKVLTAGIDATLTETVGHTIELAVVLFAFRRCVEHYDAAIPKDAPVRLQRRQYHLIHCAWRLIGELEQFHGLPVRG